MAWTKFWDGYWYNDTTGEERSTSGDPNQEDAARFAALPDHQRAPQIWGFGGQTKTLLNEAARAKGIDPATIDGTPYAESVAKAMGAATGSNTGGWMLGANDAYIANHILADMATGRFSGTPDPRFAAQAATFAPNGGDLGANGYYNKDGTVYKQLEQAGFSRDEALRRSNDYSQWDQVEQGIIEVAPIALAMAMPALLGPGGALASGSGSPISFADVLTSAAKSAAKNALVQIVTTGEIDAERLGIAALTGGAASMAPVLDTGLSPTMNAGILGAGVSAIAGGDAKQIAMGGLIGAGANALNTTLVNDANLSRDTASALTQGAKTLISGGSFSDALIGAGVDYGGNAADHLINGTQDSTTPYNESQTKVSTAPIIGAAVKTALADEPPPAQTQTPAPAPTPTQAPAPAPDYNFSFGSVTPGSQSIDRKVIDWTKPISAWGI